MGEKRMPATELDRRSVAPEESSSHDVLAMIPYNAPQIVDHGSIAEHTFTRCGGVHAPKDHPYPPAYHLDKFNECSALDIAVSP